LRKLFLEKFHWEWIFGFENRKKIFAIHSSFKFNVILLQKGRSTQFINVSFMQRELFAWETHNIKAFKLDSKNISLFSPKSKSVLEIDTLTDEATLVKMYGNGKMLSSLEDIDFGTQFHMTNDSKLFPPLTRWLDKGYHSSPEGIWRKEDEIAYPFWEGRMISHFNPLSKGWVSGKSRTAVWRDIPSDKPAVEPQYLMAESVYKENKKRRFGYSIAYMKVTSATNQRTMISSVLPPYPCGESIYFLSPSKGSLSESLKLSVVVNSFCFDYLVRLRLGGLNLVPHVLSEIAVPDSSKINLTFILLSASLSFNHPIFSTEWIQLFKQFALNSNLSIKLALSQHERLRIRCIFEAISAFLYGLKESDFKWILKECDYHSSLISNRDFSAKLSPKGFWRVDKEKPPEQRMTVLAQVAFVDLLKRVAACGGDPIQAIEAFCEQNNGEGWLLPETLCLADYELGHDERAKQPQPVRECFGPRFYDWQLAQTPEQFWQECHLHARNLLGAEGYQALLDEIDGRTPPPKVPAEPLSVVEAMAEAHELNLFNYMQQEK